MGEDPLAEGNHVAHLCARLRPEYRFPLLFWCEQQSTNLASSRRRLNHHRFRRPTTAAALTAAKLFQQLRNRLSAIRGASGVVAAGTNVATVILGELVRP
jgi:hypothetical protein